MPQLKAREEDLTLYKSVKVGPGGYAIEWNDELNLAQVTKVSQYDINKIEPSREVTVIYRTAEDWMPVFHKFGEKLRPGSYDDLEIVVE